MKFHVLNEQRPEEKPKNNEEKTQKKIQKNKAYNKRAATTTTTTTICGKANKSFWVFAKRRKSFILTTSFKK